MKSVIQHNLRRAGMLPTVLAVTAGLLLVQTSPICMPENLLDSQSATTEADPELYTAELESGRTLTTEELEQLVANANQQDIVVVFMNPIPGPAGAAGLIGEVRMWAGNHHAIPPGWLPCNGQLVSRTTYFDLFHTIGTYYGAGDGATTFRLPNYRNRSPMGASDSTAAGAPLTSVSGMFTSHGGAATHTLTADELPAHRHNFDHNHQIEGADSGTVGTQLVQLIAPTTTPTVVDCLSPSPSITEATGGNLPHNNLHPYFATTYIIYAKEGNN